MSRCLCGGIRLAAILAATFALAPAAHAQTELRELMTRLELAEQTARDEAAPEPKRRDAAHRAHDLRAQLIELAPNSIHAPTWLADHAVDALARAMADAGDLTILYGIPTQDEIDRTADAAEEAADLARRARETGDRLVGRLEEDLFTETADEARIRAIERALERLIDAELEARIPLLAARAAALRAATAAAAGHDAGEAREAARDAMTHLSALRFKTDRAEAERLAMTGAVLLAAWRADPQATAAAREQFRNAAKRLALTGPGSADPPIPARTPTPDDRLRAHVRLGLLRTGGSDPAARAIDDDTFRAQTTALLRGYRHSPLASVLREAACAEMLARNTEDPEWIAAALALLIEDLDLTADPPTPHALEAGRKTAAAIELIQRSTQHAARSTRPDPRTLPRAVLLVQAMPITASEEIGRRAELLALLRAAARHDTRATEDPDIRAEALWRLAALLAEAERTSELIEGAAALADLIECCPHAPRFPAAAEAAPKLARFALARAATKSSAEDAQHARAELVRTLRAIVQTPQSPRALGDNTVDALRLELAHLLLAPPAVHTDAQTDAAPDPPVPTLAQLSEALAVLETLTPHPDDEALSEAATLIRRIATLAAAYPAARPDLTGRAMRWAESRAPRAAPHASFLRLEHARALLAAQDDAALAIIEPLAQRLDFASPEAAHVSIAEIRLTLARAERLAGKPDRAFATLKDLAAALDQPAPESDAARPPLFWECWADMLEILAQADTDNTRTAEIRLHIKRLELIDPAFGSADAAQRINTLRARLD